MHSKVAEIKLLIDWLILMTLKYLDSREITPNVDIIKMKTENYSL